MAAKMEVDVEKSGVAVGPVSTGSVSVSLHPLVIMNISEHWTRVSAQQGKPTQGNIIIRQNVVSDAIQIYTETNADSVKC